MKDMNKMKAEAITKAENFSLKILVISNPKNKYYKAQVNTQIRKTVEQSSPINNPKLKSDHHNNQDIPRVGQEEGKIIFILLWIFIYKITTILNNIHNSP